MSGIRTRAACPRGWALPSFGKATQAGFYSTTGLQRKKHICLPKPHMAGKSQLAPGRVDTTEAFAAPGRFQPTEAFAAHMDVSTVCTPQGPVLNLDFSGQKEPELTLDLSTPKKP